jgi:hypothetical protein
MGYKTIRQYAGEAKDWEEARYPLEEDFVS